MKNKGKITLLSLLLLGWIIGATYWYLCKIRSNCMCGNNKEQVDSKIEKKVEEPVKEIVELNGLSINDGEISVSNSNENIHFGFGNSNLTVPSGLSSSFDALDTYLKDNPNKKLNVTGLYSSSEQGGASLGLSRADSMANYLNLNHNIALDRINKSYKEVSDLTFDEGNTKTMGAINYSFNTTNQDELTEDQLNELKKTRLIYFESGSPIMKITPELHQYLADIKSYTDKNKDADVSVTGYTDSDGSASTNARLSEKRAQEVKTYLVDKNGINTNVLSVSGKGENNPIADNNSEEGKAKNRRVEIKLN